MSNLDFYLYISKSKLDMLYPQIPARYRAKLAAEIGINLGIFSAKIKAEPAGSIEQDATRIKMITSYLLSTEVVGNLENGGQWIKDRLDVKHVRIAENPNIFLLVGRVGDAYHLLGGSAHHVIGNARPTNVNVGYSYFGYISEQLNDVFSDDYAERMEKRKFFEENPVLIPSIQETEWANVIYEMYVGSKAPTFSIGFLARSLGSAYSWRQERCTISSPLYVLQN